MKREHCAGALVIDEALRDALSQYRARCGITAPARLPLEGVKSVEQALGLMLPDAVWAYVASCGREPLQILTHTEDGLEQAGFPRRLIAFDRDAARRSYYCLDRRTLQLACPPVHEWSDISPGGDYWKSLTAFVRWRSEPVADPFELEPKPRGESRSATAFGVGEPALVAASVPVAIRRVLHRHFGEGVVMRQIPGPVPKLEIDFGPVGLKKVLATFVTDLPNGERAPVEPEA